MSEKSYKALYRQYRPSLFSEVKGQDHIIKTLENIIVNQKISHAYLFSGPRGTGKTSVAKIFANVLNCEHKIDFDPCFDCINKGERNLDIWEIDAASNTGIDDIRNLKENIKHLPTGSKYKIYIIDEVHMLSKAAWNALLKTIEEPPKHVIFILATTDPQKIPVTVLSRVQRFNFKRITPNIIQQQLEYVYSEEGIDFETKALELIAILSNGAMRDALSMADQISIYAANRKVQKVDVEKMFGLVSNTSLIKLINLVKEKDINEILNKIHELIENGADIEKMVLSCINILTDYLVYKKTKNTALLNNTDIDELSKLKVNTIIAYEYLDLFISILKDLRYSDIPQQTLELGLLKLVSTKDDSDIDENCSLENQQESGLVKTVTEQPKSELHMDVTETKDTSLFTGEFTTNQNTDDVNELINQRTEADRNKLNEMFDDDDIFNTYIGNANKANENIIDTKPKSNHPLLDDIKVNELIENTREFSIHQNDITSEFSVVEGDILNQDDQYDPFAIDVHQTEITVAEDIFSDEHIEKINEIKQQNLEISDILNLFLNALKSKKTNNKNYQTEYQAIISAIKDNITDKQNQKFIKLFHNIKMIINTESFIVFSTSFEETLQIFNEFKQTAEFRQFIKKYFGRDICIFVILAEKIKAAREYWKQNEAEVSNMKIVPVTCKYTTTEKEEQLHKDNLEIFGDLYKIN
ncbi:DNA polymerase III subunit gamma/tau [Mycoplasma phocoenae]|uniref:DNA polymerase III subunit gamma/tau n=1 Tax=Mycoplasma phocoenae TaxID=754517 RepID=A0A858U573_9MOLU|nr:DNA polymerase III subunit gamma/tau [Mycoplasma phocoenae]QJG67201.1 DNA polymerase III subunit gamma/tau [Mycoplasma phocoenae]